jgi:hypothetical protein
MCKKKTENIKIKKMEKEGNEQNTMGIAR